MADRGTIATLGLRTKGSAPILATVRYTLRSMVCGSTHMVVGARDDSEGNSAPSLRMDSMGTFKFLWVVGASPITLSVDVKQAANASPRPRVTIKADTSIGVSSDVTGEAGSSTGWVTIGPLLVEPTSAGALEVLLENRLDYQYRVAPCYWDNITESEPAP